MREAWQKIFNASQEEECSSVEIKMIPFDMVESNPYQPRKIFNDEKIDELGQSIKTYGLLQPIILRESENKYQIVAGERRFRACRKIGWNKIPAVIKKYNDADMAAIALIENLQRENLNFFEEAEGYANLLQEFGLKQEVLAQRLGKSQSAIANKLRLLKLPEEVKNIIKNEELTERHARAILKLNDKSSMLKIVNEIVEKKMNVKDAERRIKVFIHNLGNKNSKGNKKVVIRDLRIFLNTIRQALAVIQKAGLNPKVVEKDFGDYYEVKIKFPKGLQD